ncbi:MAG TPA: DUF177 domain-containing protein [Burkholderiaceae bacterium]|nr:DUF177 domain-containing protein [Burkholderiaceae bacterium]
MVDVFQMARLGSRLEGRIAIADMPRLSSALAHRSGTLGYHCVGHIDEHGRPALQLQIEALLPVRCDRCGEVLDLPLRAHRKFFFVRTETELAAIPIDDSPEEALLGSDRFDLQSLIEDEAILQLPISPRHKFCEALGEPVGAAAAADRPHPFAPLAALRGHLRPSRPISQRPAEHAPSGARRTGGARKPHGSSR